MGQAWTPFEEAQLMIVLLLFASGHLPGSAYLNTGAGDFIRSSEQRQVKMFGEHEGGP